MSFKVLQKVFSLEDIRTHPDLEPHARAVQAEQKAPVYILRNSAVCVYSPVLIYGAQRAAEPSGCHCWPPTINLNHTDMASFGQEQENLPPPHPALRYMWTSATFYSLSIIYKAFYLCPHLTFLKHTSEMHIVSPKVPLFATRPYKQSAKKSPWEEH